MATEQETEEVKTSQEENTSQQNDAPEMIPKHRYDKRNNEYKALKSEYEQLQSQIEEKKTLEEDFKQLKSQLQQERIGKSLDERLSKENPINPDAVKKLINSEKISLDEEMQPTGIDEALEEVKNTYPELFQKQKPSGNVGVKQEPGTKKPSYTRKQLKNMSSEEFNSKKTDIMNAYKEGRIQD